MYMLTASKEHEILEIMPYKGHLNIIDTKKVNEGKVVKINRYNVAAKRKQLENLADEIKEQWIKEYQEQILRIKNLNVKIRWLRGIKFEVKNK